MSQREGSFLSLGTTGFHRIVYSDWGPEDGPVVLCVHYLTGNAHYFAPMAEHLAAQGYRVIAPDMPGRGRSDFLRNPADYNLQKYAIDITALLSHLNITEARSIRWIGASMGGFIGMILAMMENSPIGKLALIDVGPFLSAKEMQQIHSYLTPRHFSSMDELERFVTASREPAWGPVPDGYWRDFAQHSARALDDGRLTLSYDPALAIPFGEAAKTDLNLWPVWDALPIPTLILRGETSTILPPDVAAEMLTRGPGARNLAKLHTLPGCGHVPSMAMPEQIKLIEDFL